ncbi:MAG: rhomboid family intramembrane serine protease [Planctomycetota bacterium]
MVILPIRTESISRRVPRANYVLIAFQLILFAFTYKPIVGQRVESFKDRHLAFHSDSPAIHQFVTYQFLHADLGHLIGNLVCLWVFGNGVNAKIGNYAYVLFYLSGGIFAAWGYAWIHPRPFQLIGASGAIAAVTTAYLVLFPRSRVTVLVWFFVFLQFFELPAITLIGLKIIVWDNIVAPTLNPGGNVAHGAHLAGYVFGFAFALAMLFLRAAPRDQFDIIALWRRQRLRREFAGALRESGVGPNTPHGRVGRRSTADTALRVEEERVLDAVSEVRGRLSDALATGHHDLAMQIYQEFLTLAPQQCLSERQQLTLGREFYAVGRYAEAIAAFERFLESYGKSLDAFDIRMLVGIMYARDLQKYEIADQILTDCLPVLRDGGRRELCLRWLRDVRAALGRSAPEP